MSIVLHHRMQISTSFSEQMKKYIRKTPLKEDCPLEITLNVISGKWKPAILSALFRGPKRPRDLSEGLPEATKRVITQQLKQLENDGIISKRVYDEVPIRVEYFLTDVGESLLPVIGELSKWGEYYESVISHYAAGKEDKIITH